MTGHNQPRGKIVRRLGINVFGNGKYSRLLERKPHGPGKAPGNRKRGRTGDYSLQLLEKQKLKYTYGVSERQLRNLYKKAASSPGRTGDTMLRLLEQRLDNIVYVSGFARTRGQARQMVSHGHFLVNGRRADIPSLRVIPGDRVTAAAHPASTGLVRSSLASRTSPLPPWILRDDGALSLAVSEPRFSGETPLPAEMHLVVEYFAR